MMVRQNNNNKQRLRQTRAQLGRRRRGRRSRGSRRSRGGSHYIETFPVSIEIGETAKLTVKDLTHRPKDFPFRIQYVHFVGLTSYAPAITGANSQDGYYGPSAIQITLCNSITSGSIDIVSSGPVMLGNNPRNIKVHQPRSEDWWQPNTGDTVEFAHISAICFGNASATSPKRYIRGIIHVFIKLGAIVGTPTCRISWQRKGSGSYIGIMQTEAEYAARTRNSSSMLTSGSSEVNEDEAISDAVPGLSGNYSSPGLSGDFEHIEI